MYNVEIRLNDLPIGMSGRVLNINADGNIKNRLLDLGLIPETKVEAIRKSPAGDPVAYRIRGAIMALRSEESQLVTVYPI